MDPTTHIERNTIYPIPLNQRHGRARDLFTLWFGLQHHGVDHRHRCIGDFLVKLPLGGAIFAIAFGNMVGGIFMALHAAQGPELGVPQMVQSRGQSAPLAQSSWLPWW